MTTFFEDIAVGTTEVLGSHTFTAEEIKTFAGAYDPQPFHLDEAAGAASHFGGLCASGWHTAGIWMRLRVARSRALAEAAAAEGRPVARIGPSPGFRDMRWLKPVMPGDTLTYRGEVIGKRESASRPGWGLITAQNWADNQRGERVFEFKSTAFWERRGS